MSTQKYGIVQIRRQPGRSGQPVEPQPALLPRRAVQDRLEAMASYRFILLRAPAGYGKTSLMRLLYQRLAGQGVAWLTLFESDNDPARLRQRLQQALLVDAAAAAGQVRVLFIDDLEKLQVAATTVLCKLLQELAPSGMRIYVGCRTVHGTGVAKLKANRVLGELDINDFRFSPEETSHYLAQLLPRPTPRQLAHIHAMTEGWPAAVELLALAWGRMRHGIADPLPDLYSASDLGQYVVEEAFLSQPGEIRDFIVATVLLKTLTPALCDAVRGASDSARVMDAMQAAGLPLQTVQGTELRYHPLFAECISKRYPQPRPARRLALLRAGHCLLRQGQAREAMDYYLQAEDFTRAAQVLDSFVDELRAQVQYYTIVAWIERLPVPLVMRFPRIATAMLAGCTYLSRFAEAETWLYRVEQAAALPGADPRFGDSLRVHQPHLAMMIDADWRRAVALAEAYWPQQQSANPFDFTSSANLMYWTAIGRGKLAAAEQYLARMSCSCAQSGCVLPGAANEFAQVYLLAIRGDFDAALAHISELEQRNKRSIHEIAYLYPVYRCIPLLLYYETNQLSKAQMWFEQASAQTVGPVNWAAMPIRLIFEARMLATREGTLAALRWLAREAALGAGKQSALVRQFLDAELSRLAVVLADPWLIQEQLAQMPETPPPEECFIWAVNEVDGAGIANARLLLHSGQHAAAILRLEQMLQHALSAGRLWRATKVRVLLALAHCKHRAAPAAEQAMVAALEQGARSGLVRTFLDEGEEVRRLLQGLQKKAHHLLSKPAIAHLHQLLQADGETAGAIRLTSTEQAILAQAAQGNSNQKIAELVCLSPNTVKWHMAQIFRKLDVGNRSQAVFKARQSGMI